MATLTIDFLVKNNLQVLGGKIGQNATQQHTIPAATSDTLALLAASQALTNKTYNGNTWTAGTGTLTLAAGKTLTANNSITLAGTDGTTITLPASTGTLPLNNQTFFLGTTSITINRTTAAQSLTGITSIDGYSSGVVGGGLGDLLYQSAANTTAKLADVATGSVLISGGIGAAPSYGKVGLTTHISGTLAVANGGTGVGSSTGTVAVVLSNSPTLVTPTLGAALATSINGLSITSSTGTLTLAALKTFTVNNTITLAGTDAQTYTFPTTTASIARTDAAQSFTGNQTFNNNVVVTGNLTVNGTVTSINSSTISVDDINIELGSVASPTDTTANGGGITLLGTTNKTITWTSGTSAWTSSENWNIVTGKAYQINNVNILSATALGSSVVGSSLTSVGTIATGVWQGTVIGDSYIASALTGKTYNALTLTPNATGFTISGGTTAVALSLLGGAAYSISGTNTAAYVLPAASGTLALNNQAFFLGTTSIAINRTSAAIALTGITSIDGSSASCTGNAATATNATQLGGTAAAGYALVGQSMYIGTTLFAINRASASIALTGITSIDGSSASCTGNAATATNSTQLGGVAASGYALVGQTHYIGTTLVAINRASATLDLTGVTVASFEIGYRDVPQNAQAVAYTLALTDRNKHIYYTGAAANLTVPTNASVAFPIGATITIFNNGSGALTIVTTSITMYQAGTANTGNRTVAAKGLVTLLKVGTDTWVISGNGLT